MERNRAATLAKALAKDRALEARERKDKTIRELHLSDQEAYPGSRKFSEAVRVIAQYLSDLTDAKVSSVQDAYIQAGTAITGQTVEEALSALHASFQEVIGARIGAWQGTLGLMRVRTNRTVAGEAALAEARRELERQSNRLYKKAESKLDVLLQSSLAAAERVTNGVPRLTMPRTATVLSILIASPSDVAKEREVLSDVIQEWNAVHSVAEGIVLQPIKWESHAYPESGDRTHGGDHLSMKAVTP